MGDISTRTPEGEPARCPVCRAEPLVVPSAFPTPDACCPTCGSLLWLTGDPRRVVGGQNPGGPAVSWVEAAIRQGAGWLRGVQEAGLPVPERASLGLQEITDPVEIRALEEAVGRPG